MTRVGVGGGGKEWKMSWIDWERQDGFLLKTEYEHNLFKITGTEVKYEEWTQKKRGKGSFQAAHAQAKNTFSPQAYQPQTVFLSVSPRTVAVSGYLS